MIEDWSHTDDSLIDSQINDWRKDRRKYYNTNENHKTS